MFHGRTISLLLSMQTVLTLRGVSLKAYAKNHTQPNIFTECVNSAVVFFFAATENWFLLEQPGLY